MTDFGGPDGPECVHPPFVGGACLPCAARWEEVYGPLQLDDAGEAWLRRVAAAAREAVASDLPGLTGLKIALDARPSVGAS